MRDLRNDYFVKLIIKEETEQLRAQLAKVTHELNALRDRHAKDVFSLVFADYLYCRTSITEVRKYMVEQGFSLDVIDRLEKDAVERSKK